MWTDLGLFVDRIHKSPLESDGSGGVCGGGRQVPLIYDRHLITDHRLERKVLFHVKFGHLSPGLVMRFRFECGARFTVPPTLRHLPSSHSSICRLGRNFHALWSLFASNARFISDWLLLFALCPNIQKSFLDAPFSFVINHFEYKQSDTERVRQAKRERENERVRSKYYIKLDSSSPSNCSYISSL